MIRSLDGVTVELGQTGNGDEHRSMAAADVGSKRFAEEEMAFLVRPTLGSKITYHCKYSDCQGLDRTCERSYSRRPGADDTSADKNSK